MCVYINIYIYICMQTQNHSSYGRKALFTAHYVSICSESCVRREKQSNTKELTAPPASERRKQLRPYTSTRATKWPNGSRACYRGATPQGRRETYGFLQAVGERTHISSQGGNHSSACSLEPVGTPFYGPTATPARNKLRKSTRILFDSLRADVLDG